MNAERLDRVRREGGWFLLRDRAQLRLTGADRVRYLNGQVTNDVRRLVPGGAAQQACVLSARGKLDAVVWIWAEAEALVVDVETDLAEALAARLERYIVADDVTLEALPMAKGVHVFGLSAAATEGRLIARLDVAGVDREDSPAHLLEASPAEIERLRIERARPKWGAELGPDTLPAEAGLDETAVDFHKGCYIGQEVVSRVRSVGHANRALRRFELLAGAPPKVGDEFFVPGETARAAAVITSVDFALAPTIGLCYIKRGTSDDALLTSADGSASIQIRPPARPHA